MGNKTTVMSPQRQQSCLNCENKLSWLHECIKYWMFHFSDLAAASPNSVELIYTSSLEKWPAGPGVLTVRLVHLDLLIFCSAAGCVISLTNILAQGVPATQHGACILSNGNPGWVTFQGKSLHLASSKGLREFSAGFTPLALVPSASLYQGDTRLNSHKGALGSVSSVIPAHHLLWQDSLGSKRVSFPAVLQLLSLRCLVSSAKANITENEIFTCAEVELAECSDPWCYQESAKTDGYMLWFVKLLSYFKGPGWCNSLF